MTAIRMGDILDTETGIIAHVVNNRRLMGAGLAGQIAKKWPAVRNAYKLADVTLGNCDVIFINQAKNAKLAVANLYAQDGVGVGVRVLHYGYLVDALEKLMIHSALQGMSIHIPYGMGCGLAGGDWSVVKEIVQVLLPDATIVQRKEDV